MSELIKILRDIADGKKSSLGDYWSISYCYDAADKLEQQQEQISKLNRDYGVMYKLQQAGEARITMLETDNDLLADKNHEHRQRITTLESAPNGAEKVIEESIVNLELSEHPFYVGIKGLKEYEREDGSKINVALLANNKDKG